MKDQTSTKVLDRVNVAEQSTSGHYLVDCKVEVVNKEEGTYVFTPNSADGTTVLETSNHGKVTACAPTGGAIFTQVEFNNYSALFERARD